MDEKPGLVSIFGEAIGIADLSDRAAFLDNACGGDGALRAQLEALLTAEKKAGPEFLERPSEQTCSAATSASQPGKSSALSATIDEAIGAKVGPYKLIHKLGEGGMGTVYMAEQSEPVKRKVALKIVKAGMDSAQVLARFEVERQALAMMDHPSIARVLDAGTTKNGLPYFVMELVSGVPITRYCDEIHMPLRERLALFVDVCRAIQHAHHKGVIHRDIKPSNVLVTLVDDKPVPKVIDFGVAKAMGQKLTDATMNTQMGAIIGTLEYMSPEQAAMSALGVDVRSDIYSLGVLLYELLTGTTPLDKKRAKDATILELLRIIKEEEPQKPSTRITTSKEQLPDTAAKRHIDPSKLAKQMRGELDWIAMRALEKDRTRRYESANGLARDVERYLNDEPVEACPPSGWYRFRKMTARNKGVFTALGAIAATLTIGMGVSTYLFLKEKEARKRAVVAEESATVAKNREEQLKEEALAAKARSEKSETAARSEAAKSRKVMELTNEMLQQIGQANSQPASNQPMGEGFWNKKPPTLEQVLEIAERNITNNLKDSPEVQAALLCTISAIYRNSDDYDKAEELVRRSLQLRRNVYGGEHPDVAESLETLASVLKANDDLSGAENPQREAVTIRRKHQEKEPKEMMLAAANLAVILISLSVEKKATNKEGSASDAREAEDLYNQIAKLADAQTEHKAQWYRDAADIFARRGAWRHAAAMLDKTRAYNESGMWNVWYVLQMAPLRIETGALEAYKALRKQALADFGDTDKPVDAERLAKACLLLPPDHDDSEKLERLVSRALAGTEKNGFREFFEFVKGLNEYRNGRNAEAIDWINKSRSRGPREFYESSFVAVLSMAKFKMNKTDEARAELAKAIKLATEIPPLYSEELVLWHDWLYSQIFIREARTLIDGKEPAEPYVTSDFEKKMKE